MVAANYPSGSHNFFKGLFSAIRPTKLAVQKALGDARNYIDRKISSSGEALGEWVIKKVKSFFRLRVAGAVGVVGIGVAGGFQTLGTILTTKFPDQFGWLDAFLRYLGLS